MTNQCKDKTKENCENYNFRHPEDEFCKWDNNQCIIQPCNISSEKLCKKRDDCTYLPDQQQSCIINPTKIDYSPNSKFYSKDNNNNYYLNPEILNNDSVNCDNNGGYTFYNDKDKTCEFKCSKITKETECNDNKHCDYDSKDGCKPKENKPAPGKEPNPRKYQKCTPTFSNNSNKPFHLDDKTNLSTNRINTLLDKCIYGKVPDNKGLMFINGQTYSNDKLNNKSGVVYDKNIHGGHQMLGLRPYVLIKIIYVLCLLIILFLNAVYNKWIEPIKALLIIKSPRRSDSPNYEDTSRDFAIGGSAPPLRAMSFPGLGAHGLDRGDSTSQLRPRSLSVGATAPRWGESGRGESTSSTRSPSQSLGADPALLALEVLAQQPPTNPEENKFTKLIINSIGIVLWGICLYFGVISKKIFNRSSSTVKMGIYFVLTLLVLGLYLGFAPKIIKKISNYQGRRRNGQQSRDSAAAAAESTYDDDTRTSPSPVAEREPEEIFDLIETSQHERDSGLPLIYLVQETRLGGGNKLLRGGALSEGKYYVFDTTTLSVMKEGNFKSFDIKSGDTFSINDDIKIMANSPDLRSLKKQENVGSDADQLKKLKNIINFFDIEKDDRDKVYKKKEGEYLKFLKRSSNNELVFKVYNKKGKNINHDIKLKYLQLENLKEVKIGFFNRSNKGIVDAVNKSHEGRGGEYEDPEPPPVAGAPEPVEGTTTTTRLPPPETPPVAGTEEQQLPPAIPTRPLPSPLPETPPVAGAPETVAVAGTTTASAERRGEPDDDVLGLIQIVNDNANVQWRPGGGVQQYIKMKEAGNIDEEGTYKDTGITLYKAQKAAACGPISVINLLQNMYDEEISTTCSGDIPLNDSDETLVTSYLLNLLLQNNKETKDRNFINVTVRSESSKPFDFISNIRGGNHWVAWIVRGIGPEKKLIKIDPNSEFNTENDISISSGTDKRKGHITVFTYKDGKDLLKESTASSTSGGDSSFGGLIILRKTTDSHKWNGTPLDGVDDDLSTKLEKIINYYTQENYHPDIARNDLSLIRPAPQDQVSSTQGGGKRKRHKSFKKKKNKRKKSQKKVKL
jgi:hypothetical protein